METTNVIGFCRNNNLDDLHYFSSESKGMDILLTYDNIEVLSVGVGKYDIWYAWTEDKLSLGTLFFGKWNGGNLGFRYEGKLK